MISLGLGDSPELIEFLDRDSSVFTAESRARHRSRVAAVASAGVLLGCRQGLPRRQEQHRTWRAALTDSAPMVAPGFGHVASAARTMTGFALKPLSFALTPLIRLAREDPGKHEPAVRFVPKQLTSLQADYPFTDFLEVGWGGWRQLAGDGIWSRFSAFFFFFVYSRGLLFCVSLLTSRRPLVYTD